MSQRIDAKVDIDSNLERIEEEIVNHDRIIENLVWRRSELLTKREDLEMCELIDCIVENGLTANEALEMIIEALEKKKHNN
jgi:hypothetical protein